MSFFNSTERTDDIEENWKRCDIVGKGLTHLFLSITGAEHVPEENQFELYDSKYKLPDGTIATFEAKTHSNLVDCVWGQRDVWLYCNRENSIADYYMVWGMVSQEPHTWLGGIVQGSIVRSSPKKMVRSVSHKSGEAMQYIIPFKNFINFYKLVTDGDKVTRYKVTPNIFGDIEVLTHESDMSMLLSENNSTILLGKLVGYSTRNHRSE